MRDRAAKRVTVDAEAAARAALNAATLARVPKSHGRRVERPAMQSVARPIYRGQGAAPSAANQVDGLAVMAAGPSTAQAA